MGGQIGVEIDNTEYIECIKSVDHNDIEDDKNKNVGKVYLLEDQIQMGGTNFKDVAANMRTWLKTSSEQKILGSPQECGTEISRPISHVVNSLLYFYVASNSSTFQLHYP